MFYLLHTLLLRINCLHLKMRRFYLKAGFLASLKRLTFWPQLAAFPRGNSWLELRSCSPFQIEHGAQCAMVTPCSARLITVSCLAPVGISDHSRHCTCSCLCPRHLGPGSQLVPNIWPEWRPEGVNQSNTEKEYAKKDGSSFSTGAT